MTNASDGMQELVLRLVEEMDGRRFGKYRGVVKDNVDPEGCGRLRLLIPSVLGQSTSEWAMPCLPFGGKHHQGLFFVPDIDSCVWVEFEEGDIDRPIWSGVYWQIPQKGEASETERGVAPTLRSLRTPGEHLLEFDDTKGRERIQLKHKSGAELTITANGNVHLDDASGNTLQLDGAESKLELRDCQRNTLTMSAEGISLKDFLGNVIEMGNGGITLTTQGRVLINASQVLLGGEGGESVICGERFLMQFMAHRHTVAPIVGGPTSPPVPQGEISTLSTTVRTK
jgi:hypothetical protein